VAYLQVDYILGVNPNNMSYMVGFGSNYPKQVHHRASSIPSTHVRPENMTCKQGWPYYGINEENPNVLVGAVVGGPDKLDKFEDLRWNFEQSEPAIYINAPLTGVLAYCFGENSLLCDLLDVETMGGKSGVKPS
jgi:endoglucanase